MMLETSNRGTGILGLTEISPAAPRLFCGLRMAALFALKCGLLKAAEWNGLVDSRFQNGGNWCGANPPRAGEQNQTLLQVANGSGTPLSYTQADGTTGFTEQLVIGGSKSGPTGEMRMSGGTLMVRQKLISFIGQVNGGKLVVQGGTLSLLGGGQDSDVMNSDACWTLVLGNENTGNGVIEISGGTLNLENGFQLGRRGGAGMMILSGTGHFICSGPILFPGGSGTKCIVLGDGNGVFEQNKNGEILFLGDDGQGWFDFKPGSRGKISVCGHQKSYFDGMVSEGRIRIDNQRTTPAHFVFNQNGNQGEYQLAP